MDRDTVSRIETWESRPLADGYAGLHDLAEASFSGAVSTNGSWLILLNGRIIGVPTGAIEDFESTAATAYQAPHPSLPLLTAMRDVGGQQEGRYFTDDTPLREVHETLSSGNFTGYVELSENVLSGDYYVCYYGGRSLSVAFVGNAERLLTGDEAFDRATEEVGIFEVHSVDLSVTSIPKPSEPEEAAAGGVVAPEESAEPDAATAALEDDGAEEVTDTQAAASPESVDESSTADTRVEPGEEPVTESTPTEVTEPTADPEPTPDTVSEPPEQPPARAEEGDAGEAAQSPDEDPFSEEAAWRKSTTVPALDPDETEDLASRQARTAEDRSTEPDQPAADGPGAEPADPGTGQEAPATDDVAATEDIDQLEAKLEAAVAERDQLAEEREQLRRQLHELEASQATATTDSGEGSNRELSVDEALDGTDLFVRYGSRGQSTLESAHDDQVDRETVIQNLRIEEHTRFDADSVIVGGQPYEAFLAEQLEYRFVRWVAETLLFEIRDTGNQKGLKAVYDALPQLDRAEFNGTVTARDESGNEHSQSFDVVVRDRMGQPLFVAQLNDQRDPATGGMMADLIERASDVAEGHETLVGVFLVTASFFQPDALETANEATGGGFFSRDAKRSFVRLSRRSGYHLCLVEARRGEFHVAVPEF